MKNKVSKRKIIEQALAELGTEAGRAAIIEYAREKFGVVLTPAHVSSTASHIRRELKEGGEEAQESTGVPIKRPEGIASDLGRIRELLDKFGEEELKGLIDVLKAK